MDDEGCRRLVHTCPALAALDLTGATNVTAAGLSALTALEALTIRLAGWQAGEGGLLEAAGDSAVRTLTTCGGGEAGAPRRFANLPPAAAAAAACGSSLGAAAGASPSADWGSPDPGWRGAAARRTPRPGSASQARRPLPAGAGAYDERVRWTRAELLELRQGGAPAAAASLRDALPEDLLRGMASLADGAP